MHRVLVVCQHNVMRSPIMAFELQSRLGADYQVRSRGLQQWHSREPDEGILEVLRDYHPNPEIAKAYERHAPVRIEKRDVAKADLILVQTQEQKSELLEKFEDARNKTFLVKELGGEGNLEIPDPKGQGIQAQVDTMKSLGELAPKVAEEIRKRLEQGN